MSTTTTNKTLRLRYIKTSDLHAPLSHAIWKTPIGDGYTIIPHDTAPMRAIGMDAQADILDNYKHLSAPSPGATNYLTTEADFVFEYVVRDGEFTIENKRARGGPDKAPLRVRFWRLISGPPVDSFYYDMSLTSRDEHNCGCIVLKQLNEGLSELHRGRFIALPNGRSIISPSQAFRRSPTIRDSPANYGNPLVNIDGEITEVDYDSVYEYYYGMYGSPEYGQRERDDQDSVAFFPPDDAVVSEREGGVFSRPPSPTGI
jgi:hypothetical protein